MTMRVEWLMGAIDSDGNRRLILEQQTMFDESELVPALVVKTEDGEHAWPLETWPETPILPKPSFS